MENNFGDEVYEKGVLVKEGEWVVYTSHKGYNELLKEVINMLNNDSNNTESKGDSKG